MNYELKTISVMCHISPPPALRESGFATDYSHCFFKKIYVFKIFTTMYRGWHAYQLRPPEGDISFRISFPVEEK